MPDDLTPNLKLPYIAAAQAQKHVTHNEALRNLDAIVHLAVLDRDLSSPPTSPANGDRYLIGTSASGNWSGNSGKIGAYQDGAWEFIQPREGWLAWVADENILLVFDGAVWTAAGGGGGSASVNPTPLVGVNATADTTNRLSVKSPSSLFDNAGAGHQLKLNKASAAATGSMLFQTSYSGRAEIGLAGDDDLHVKVSADGAAWKEALLVDRARGVVKMPLAPTFTAIRTAGDVGAVSTIVFNSVTANVGNSYNGSTGHFIAPVAGKYLFYAIGLATNSSSAELQIWVNGANAASARHWASAYATTIQAFALLTLAANDDVAVTAVQGSFYGSGFTSFYGAFIG